jgi:hypothetical protein
MQKLENMFVAIAFAEAGEFDTAREMLDRPEQEAAPNKHQAGGELPVSGASAH